MCLASNPNPVPNPPARTDLHLSCRVIDEVVWVKMTVHQRLAKSHGYYLQHAKEVRLPRHPKDAWRAKASTCHSKQCWA